MKVVYNSYNGRYADNPRVIHEALVARGGGHEHTWLLDHRHAAAFPADVHTVPIGTPAAVGALGEADLLVANTHIQLDTWSPQPDAVYLQTWHGTPLKRIHRAAVGQEADAIMDELDADIARWSYLIAPSRVGGAMLRDAFSYRGSVIESGYPRNDVLNAPDHEERRAQLREELGIATGATTVLYAPTYRDDDVMEDDVPLPLNAAALAERLGESYHLLLRRHYFLGHRSPVPGQARVLDVSEYPDISHLYLAADVLVTDYSSVMFDFAVTGKPIILYAYDLEHYRDRLRGFTFDLDAEAPGPVVLDRDHLADALLDLDGVRADYGAKYAAFRDRYCHLEDGHATDRVLTALGLD